MNITEFYSSYSSDCTAGSANQVLARYDSPVTKTGRVRYRLSHGGKRYSLLFSNMIDSTYSDGTISKANDIGEPWHISSMRMGLSRDLASEPAEWKTVLFDGKAGRDVSCEDVFCTDPIELNAVSGDYLVYEITFTGTVYPYHEEIVLSVKSKDTDGKWIDDKKVPVPLMIGCDREVSLKVGFIGDSITQGCGTEPESYTHWVAKIAERLPDDISVWDLGIGYARAFDAATDKGWLERAKHCDVVNICFGVNDIIHEGRSDQVIADIGTIISSLRSAGCKVILFTVPPFEMQGIYRDIWYKVNGIIRSEFSGKVDCIFDFAKVLGQPAPNEHMSVYGGHPNAEGCKLAADEYIKQRILDKVIGRRLEYHA